MYSGCIRLRHKSFCDRGIEHIEASGKVTCTCPSAFNGTWLLYDIWMLKLWKSAWPCLSNPALKWVHTKQCSLRPGDIVGLEACFPFLEKHFAYTLFQHLFVKYKPCFFNPQWVSPRWMHPTQWDISHACRCSHLLSLLVWDVYTAWHTFCKH